MVLWKFSWDRLAHYFVVYIFVMLNLRVVSIIKGSATDHLLANDIIAATSYNNACSAKKVRLFSKLVI